MDWVLLKKVKVSYIECYSVVPWGNVLRYREDGKEIEKQAEPGSEFWTEAWSAFYRVLYNIGRKKDGLTG